MEVRYAISYDHDTKDKLQAINLALVTRAIIIDIMKKNNNYFAQLRLELLTKGVIDVLYKVNSIIAKSNNIQERDAKILKSFFAGV